jgi:hypothetical protein
MKERIEQGPSLDAVAFLLGRSGLQVTDPNDLLGNEPKSAVGALGSVFEDGDGLR